ncbi:hypothetical protein N9W79_01830 [bacterium]|nr:hypothetical protein [bacterium]
MTTSVLKLLTLFAVLCTLADFFFLVAFSCSFHGTSGFLANNTLSYPVTSNENSSLNQNQFKVIANEIQNTMVPILASDGIRLVVAARWNNPEVNLYVRKSIRDSWLVEIPGGFARHPMVNKDSLLTAFCYEMTQYEIAKENSALSDPIQVSEKRLDSLTLGCLARFWIGNDTLKNKFIDIKGSHTTKTCEDPKKSNLTQDFCVRAKKSSSQAKEFRLYVKKNFEIPPKNRLEMKSFLK